MTESTPNTDTHASDVLIVDDNPENLKVLGDFFASQGFTVRVARDGQQALASATAEKPEVILLDIHMPVLDGYETCTQIKAMPELQDCPIIFLSALGETFNKVRAFECGGCDYITKPFNLEEVRVRVNNHLQAARLLAESRAGFRATFEQAAVGMAHLSLDGAFRIVNKCLCGLAGFSESDFATRTLEGLARPASVEVVKAALEAARSGETDHPPVEVALEAASGAEIWCRLTLSRVRAPATGEHYIAAIIEDVTAHHRAVAERRRLATALEQTAEAVAITDAEGITQYVNPAYEAAFGIASQDLTGKKLAIVADESPEYPRAAEVWEAIAANGVWTGRVERSLGLSRPRTEEFAISPVRDSSGAITNYIAVGRDVSGKLQLEERLRQSQKMEAIGTLAAGIAHDFNNLLAAILGFTQLTMDELPAEHASQANLREVVSAAGHATELVRQILSFARQSPFEIRPVRLQEVAEESIKLLRRSIPPTIHIRTNIDENCCPVLADATAIQQILMNLCTNAYHAMESEGGSLTIRVSEVIVGDEPIAPGSELTPGKYARLDVIDTGHGMDKETLQRVFEPYFTTKERGQGTGLGLATVHGIVTGLHGALSAYSEPGSGSTFTVFLPEHRGEVPADTTPAPVPDNAEGTERILFVDDEKSLCTFAERALGRLGYQVTAINDPVEALEQFLANPDAFDLVIIDEMMPKLRGSELLPKMRAVRPDILAVLYSGFAEGLRPERGDGRAFDAYVMKPLVVSDLAKAIRSVCAGREPKSG